MALRSIKVPDIGEGIAEVELVEWHVKAGDPVAEDQALADVMTDKASVEIPSPVAGTVVALGGEVGKMLAVGSELIRIETDAAAAEAEGEARPAPPPVVEKVKAASPAPTLPAAPPPSRPSAPASRADTAPPRTDRPIASPSVRRRAWELGIDLNNVKASGPGGRVLHADLEGAPVKTTNAPRPAAPATGAKRTDEQALQVIGLRRKIAQKMQESKRRIPHFSYVEEIDVTEVEALRGRLNQRWAEQRGKLTLLPLLVRALVLAVREVPEVNARFDDEAGVVTRYGAVHLGIATQTGNGLMVPVVRHAEALDLWASAAEVARLADVARRGKATRDELTGSTITISSLGALGGIVTTPVINHPEVAIVGVNRIVVRPMLHGGSFVARQTMNLSSSFDHRVVDGMDAARFIQAMRAALECPALLFVE